MKQAKPLSPAVHYLQQATGTGACRFNGLPGCWQLSPGRALTLRASQTGALRIAHGRVWITFDDAGLDSKVRAGDYFLSQGESLPVVAGQALVMESFVAGAADAAWFNWEPVTVTAGIVQPLLDLRLALGLASAALARLVRGLMGGLLGGVRV